MLNVFAWILGLALSVLGSLWTGQSLWAYTLTLTGDTTIDRDKAALGLAIGLTLLSLALILELLQDIRRTRGN